MSFLEELYAETRLSALAHSAIVMLEEDCLVLKPAGDQPGVATLLICVDHDDQVRIEVGETISLEMFGQQDRASISSIGVIVKAVLDGTLREQRWERDGKVVKSRALFPNGEIAITRSAISLWPKPTVHKSITYIPYALKR